MQVVPNQLVELHLEGPGGPQVYRTRVEDVYDDIVVVGAPLEQGAVVPIRIGTELRIEFKLRGPGQEGRFSNRAIVEKRFRTTIPLLQMRLLGQWEKTQERMFVRVPVHLDAVVVPLTEGGEELPAEPGLIRNLSGGGFLLRSTRAFELDEEMRISFRVGTEQIRAKAYVARFVPTDEGHDFGCGFLEIAENMRKAVIRFVFRRQIELAEITREDIT